MARIPYVSRETMPDGRTDLYDRLVRERGAIPENVFLALANVPDLAEAWKWNDSGRELTFTLRHNIKWHDGNPFTANDVKCSWDLLTGKAKEKLRLNAREAWWANLSEVSADNETQVTFHLKRPQPSFLALLASGLSPVLRHLMSKNFSAPRSAPNPASVTT